MKIVLLIIASLAGYLIGSIPFALVIGKVFYHTDVRQFGSGNLGGTNAGRVLGAKAGLSVIILDAIKAFIIMAIVCLFDREAALYAGTFAAIGHCYPIFAHFKGGKAVATTFGYLLGVVVFIVPEGWFTLFLLPLIIFLILLRLSKMVSFSAILALLLAVILSWIFAHNLEVSVLTSLLVVMVILRHRENISRIRQGNERKVHIFDKKLAKG